MSDKILSIIVPSYNMETYLSKCLRSLVVSDRQFLQKLDVIVVNDGSKDRTSEIAHEFELNYPGVFRVIDKLNGNYGSCVNAGLSIALGRYVKVLDADDSLDVDAFGEYLAKICFVDVDLILNGYDKVDDNANVIERMIYPMEEDKTFDLSMTKGCYIGLHAITYRTEILRAMSYRQTEGVSYTDTEWAVLPMVSVRRVVNFKRPLVKYLIGREGQTMSPRKFANDFWMLERVYLDLFKKASTLAGYCDQTCQEWLDGRLRDLLHYLYDLSAAGYQGVPVKSNLRDFDERLKDANRVLYEYAESVQFPGRLFPIRYVHEMRRHPVRYFFVSLVMRFYVKCLSLKKRL